MKKLELEGKNGGFPFRLNDIEHSQDGLIDSISQIYEFFLSSEHDSLYLKRAVFSFDGNGNFWHAEGWLYWNGEVFYIPERLEQDKVPTSYNFIVITNYVPQAGIPFRAGNTELVRADRILSLADTTALNPEDFVQSGIPTIDEVFGDKMIEQDDKGWTNLPINTNSIILVYQTFQYKIELNVLKFRGSGRVSGAFIGMLTGDVDITGYNLPNLSVAKPITWGNNSDPAQYRQGALVLFAGTGGEFNINIFEGQGQQPLANSILDINKLEFALEEV